MKKLSTGQDSTLKNWLRLSRIFFGEGSEAVKFLKNKIDVAPNGENEEVIADEPQLIFMLYELDKNTKNYPFFECPKCHKRSYSQGDIDHRYCVICDEFF